MRDISALFLHAIAILIRLARPGGLRSVVAESVLMRHQVLILNRGRKWAPNLRSLHRIIAALCTLLMRPARVLRSAVLLKPSTLLHFHKMLTKQKYRLLFSSTRVRRPGPKGPTKSRSEKLGRGVSSRQSCESCEVKVLVPLIACSRADSKSDACEGNDARSARM
jgi:hypothetical protein